MNLLSLGLHDGGDNGQRVVSIELTIMTVGRKTKRIVARISQRDKALLERAAALEGRTIAAFVVKHAVAKAEQLVELRQIIRLDAAQSRQLVEALLAPPPKPTEVARRALTDRVPAAGGESPLAAADNRPQPDGIVSKTLVCSPT